MGHLKEHFTPVIINKNKVDVDLISLRIGENSINLQFVESVVSNKKAEKDYTINKIVDLKLGSIEFPKAKLCQITDRTLAFEFSPIQISTKS